MAPQKMLGACLLAAATLPAVAGGPPLTLDDAFARALADNPRLMAGSFRSRAAQAYQEQAEQAPPLEIGFDLENVAGNNRTAGLSGAEATLTLSGVLERGDKASLRGQLADARGTLVRTERDIDRLELLADVAERFIHVVRDQQLLAVAEAAVALASAAQEEAQRRVDAGAAPETESARATIALADARLDQEHAEHELKATRVSLASLWGERAPRFGPAQASLATLPEASALPDIVAGLERNPQLRRLAEQRRIEAARQQLAQGQAATDIRLSGGLRRREEAGDTSLVLGLSVPWGSTQRAQPGIRASEAEVAAQQRMYQAVRRELYAIVYARYQEMVHAGTEVAMLRSDILPAAQSALEAIQDGYARGRYGYLELATAQEDLIAHRRRFIDAAYRYHRHLIEIERLTGTAAAAPMEKAS
ncbi:TolC family protein [Algiphilus sp.]|uniref:TolC family protein n=1 Tax=Algiphilus sp. TaxID=1872431 RepID=UPI001CA6C246|nr:TolC family protein [Algiphilus sp.]MBY8965230.1 TolC family protein [Algiphilus acroporae]MCI5063636.1 TolC family protein [Algiphilus sp.]MCI5104821.1 TolC family protein [Algiphilus sp.]